MKQFWTSRAKRGTASDRPPPYPPAELMALVGHTSTKRFDNPDGLEMFPDVDPAVYESVLDWGCGCGRIARRMMTQAHRPRAYLGIDLHAGMIEWCRENLTAHDPAFRFHHQDIHNLGLNPNGTKDVEAFPVDDRSVTLFIGWSVFTHVTQSSASFYLRELGRVLHPDGVAKTTWFLFDKRLFPMMQTFQNALFINDVDPTNAVIFDEQWLLDELSANDLVLVDAVAPAIRGFHWLLTFGRSAPGRSHVEFPVDDAPLGAEPPPVHPTD